MISFPTRVVFRRASTSTAETTASEVVDSAAPAISEAFNVRPSGP